MLLLADVVGDLVADEDDRPLPDADPDADPGRAGWLLELTAPS